MQPQDLKGRLRGVIAFAPTPFTDTDAVDIDGLQRQVDSLCRSGAHAIVVCGVVGEFYSLEQDEYRDCIRAAVQAAGGRLPLLAGIGHNTRIASRLAAFAESVGADGLMINPCYLVEPTDAGTLAHYEALSHASSLGLIVFSTRGWSLSPATIERLTSVESVIAFKDEVGDLKRFSEAMERVGDRLVWINGMAESYAVAYAAAGAQAFTSGIVNFAPRLATDVWEACNAGDFHQLRHIVATQIRPISRLRERQPGYSVAVLKEAMNMLGLPGGKVRLPLQPLESADRDELREILERLSLLERAPARVALSA